jgi:(2Fe-2S) ferredoxin
MRTRSEGRGLADAVWYGYVTEADVEEIMESHILGGKPVQRLRRAGFCLNTAS